MIGSHRLLRYAGPLLHVVALARELLLSSGSGRRRSRRAALAAQPACRAAAAGGRVNGRPLLVARYYVRPRHRSPPACRTGCATGRRRGGRRPRARAEPRRTAATHRAGGRLQDELRALVGERLAEAPHDGDQLRQLELLAQVEEVDSAARGARSGTGIVRVVLEDVRTWLAPAEQLGGFLHRADFCSCATWACGAALLVLELDAPVLEAVHVVLRLRLVPSTRRGRPGRASGCGSRRSAGSSCT